MSTNGAGSPAFDEPDPNALLEVRDLRTTFITPRGPLVAVDGVSLDPRSAARRSASSASPGPARPCSPARSWASCPAGTPPSSRARSASTASELVGASEQTLRSIWGLRIAMVFQDPMTSLNPVHGSAARSPRRCGCT